MKQTHPYLNTYFFDEYGRRRYASSEVYQKIVKRLGSPKSRQILPLVKVVKAGQAVYIPLHIAIRICRHTGNLRLKMARCLRVK
mgnify:CR=1 FL=1